MPQKKQRKRRPGAQRRGYEDGVDRLFSPQALRDRQRVELLSVVCRLFSQGKTAEQILAELKNKKYARYTTSLNREDAWRLVRRAAENGWFQFQPPLEIALADRLAKSYAWPEGQITVVASPLIAHIASRAASKLLDLIRLYHRFGRDAVHIGFAGGRMLRRVAEELSKLLRIPSSGNPRRIVFHAMVAAFDEEHFEADPNNFITYFTGESVSIDIGFVPMPVPGLVEAKLRDQLHEFRAVRHVYERAGEIDIIVTGGGSWVDEHSALRTYMSQMHEPDVKTLASAGTVGDLLWQPVSAVGPIDMDAADLEFRANTLVELRGLPDLIKKRNVRTMLVLGPCSQCLSPHGELLDAILGTLPRLVTDVSNVHDLVNKTGRETA